MKSKQTGRSHTISPTTSTTTTTATTTTPLTASSPAVSPEEDSSLDLLEVIQAMSKEPEHIISPNVTTTRRPKLGMPVTKKAKPTVDTTLRLVTKFFYIEQSKDGTLLVIGDESLAGKVVLKPATIIQAGVQFTIRFV